MPCSKHAEWFWFWSLDFCCHLLLPTILWTFGSQYVMYQYYFKRKTHRLFIHVTTGKYLITMSNWSISAPSSSPRKIPPLPTTTHRWQSFPRCSSVGEGGRSLRISLSLSCRSRNPKGGGYWKTVSVKGVSPHRKGSITGVLVGIRASIPFRANAGLHSLFKTLRT